MYKLDTSAITRTRVAAAGMLAGVALGWAIHLPSYTGPTTVQAATPVSIPIVMTAPEYDGYQRHVMLVVASWDNTPEGRARNLAWLATLTPEMQQRIWDVDNAIADLCAANGTPLGGPTGCGL